MKVIDEELEELRHSSQSSTKQEELTNDEYESESANSKEAKEIEGHMIVNIECRKNDYGPDLPQDKNLFIYSSETPIPVQETLQTPVQN